MGRYSVAGQVICGRSCSLINHIRPAAEIVEALAREATLLLSGA